MEGGDADLMSNVEKHSLLNLSLVVVHLGTVNERNRTGKYLCAKALYCWKHTILPTYGPALTKDLCNRRKKTMCGLDTLANHMYTSNRFRCPMYVVGSCSAT